MNKIEYLIISSTVDYATDLICYELHKKEKSYLRINRDDFLTYSILFDMQQMSMKIEIDEETYVTDCQALKGIYFRAPVFLRSFKHYTVEEQLYRSQWNAFVKNLILFDKTIWINNPVDTYRAENKMFQLAVAKKVGMHTPETYVGNTLPNNYLVEKRYAIKSLDTALFYSDFEEYFTYTSVVQGADLEKENLIEAPVFLQEYIENKVDLRVTYVDGNIFPIKILIDSNPIEGDWRQNPKDKLEYVETDLPRELNEKIIMLMSELGLNFGGIDFALSNGKYYFIEVNPTGEWGWVQTNTSYKISESIVNKLCGEY